jgi:single-strand DNA-binding protein
MWLNLSFVGRCGADPEVRYLPDGKPVCNLSVAVRAGFGEKRHTQWMRVSCFGKQAEFAAANVHKGKRVLVSGVLNDDPSTGGPRVYTKADGTAGAGYDVYCDDLRVIDWAEESGGNGDGNSASKD